MKKRADGRYCKQIVVGYRPNGSRIVKTIYGTTIREVERKERELRKSIENGVQLFEENITVGEWGLKWLEVYKVKTSRNTYSNYRNCLKNHILPTIGSIPIQKLKPIQIQGAINDLLKQGKTRTAEMYKLTIKQIVTKAVEEDIITKNVCSGLDKIKSTTKEKRVLTDFEMECISKTMYTEREKMFLDVLYYTGIRRGEALALTIWDIDKQARILKINKSLDIGDNEPVIKEPKSRAGNREIPIPDILFAKLTIYLSSNKSTYLFPMSNGKPMSRSSYRKMWESIVKKTKETAKEILQNNNEKIFDNDNTISFTPHTFRHTYATNLYHANMDIKRSQYLLGHSSLDMTLQVYTHLENRNNIDAANKINDFFSQSKVSQTGF